MRGWNPARALSVRKKTASICMTVGSLRCCAENQLGVCLLHGAASGHHSAGPYLLLLRVRVAGLLVERQFSVLCSEQPEARDTEALNIPSHNGAREMMCDAQLSEHAFRCQDDVRQPSNIPPIRSSRRRFLARAPLRALSTRQGFACRLQIV